MHVAHQPLLEAMKQYEQFWELNANANRAKRGHFLRDVFKLRKQHRSSMDDTHHESVEPHVVRERGTRHRRKAVGS